MTTGVGVDNEDIIDGKGRQGIMRPIHLDRSSPDSAGLVAAGDQASCLLLVD